MKTYQHRANSYDAALECGQFDAIQHKVIRLPNQIPLAVSSPFSLAKNERENESVRSVLNVFPISQGEFPAIFSFTPADAPIVRGAFTRLFEASGDYLKYELSKLIVDRVENFVLSPIHFLKWSDAKKAAIIRASISNLMTDESIADDPELMLF